jgi:hypothetical protein
VLARLDDGSHLSRIGVLTVRIISADLTVTCADGTHYTATHRLATTVCNPRHHPARRLIALYHERWEHEIAYLALRHTLTDGRVLRSTDPTGLDQEMWALLTVYQALRPAMVTAIESRPGIDPDRASFTTALETAKDLLINTAHTTDPDDLIGRIGEASLADPLPPRRPRTSVRKVKSPLSRYNRKRPASVPTQHTHHQHHRHHHRPRPQARDTRIEIIDNSPRALTTRH